MGQIVQVKTGVEGVVLGKIIRDPLDKFVLSDDDFDKLSPDIFTSVLTDLGPSVLLATATLANTTDPADIIATITPTFDGVIRSTAAIVTTAVTTGSKAMVAYPWIDYDAGTDMVITATVSGSPTGGDWTLTVDGEDVTIPFDAVAADVDDAFNDAFGSYDYASCTGDGPYVITFNGRFAATAITYSVDDSGLTGGSTPSVAVVTTTEAVPGDYVATQVDGGNISLTSANCTPVGALIAGSNIVKDSATGPASFKSGSTITLRAGAGLTAFSEGAVVFVLFCDPAPLA